MLKVALLVNPHKERAPGVALEAAKILENSGAVCYFAGTGDEILKTAFPPDRFLSTAAAIECCDMVVTVGGDGTILHTVPVLIRFPRPILGINVGHLGFLAALEPDELSRLTALPAGEYKLEPRRLLKAEVLRSAETFSAFNEFAFSCSGVVKQIGCTLICDGTPVGTYSGDGLLVASATGSTAYSLSAGGPIVDAELDVLIATPICAHTLNAPSMVFSGKRVLEISVFGNRSGNSYLVADGQEQCLLEDRDRIRVTLSDNTVSLVALEDAQQFRAVDLKLKKR